MTTKEACFSLTAPTSTSSTVILATTALASTSWAPPQSLLITVISHSTRILPANFLNHSLGLFLPTVYLPETFATASTQKKAWLPSNGVILSKTRTSDSTQHHPASTRTTTGGDFPRGLLTPDLDWQTAEPWTKEALDTRPG